jgi:hypothetical protein
MWYLPNDLLPGPTKEEPDALDLHPSRLAKFRGLYRSGVARMHAGRVGLKQFVEPIAIRWRKRNECPCEAPARIRCTVHNSKLCGSWTCTELHRWAHDHAGCEIQALRTWLDYAVYTSAVFVAGLSVVWVAVYLGVL